MEDLDATQLILLALLVSFVTSIATGIVTVTLMDQAPPAVTQTISRVVEKTVEVMVPPKTTPSTPQTVIIKEEDLIVVAAEKTSANVVTVGQLKNRFTLGIIGTAANKDDFQVTPIGTGFVITKDGFLVAQDIVVGAEEQLVIKNAAGHFFKVQIVARDEKNNIALLQSGEPITVGIPGGGASEISEVRGFTDTILANSDTVRIGQTAIALGRDEGLLLLLGVVSRLETLPKEGEKPTILAVFTTIEGGGHYVGGPLLGTDARVLGITMTTKDGVRFTVPANSLKILIEGYKKGLEEKAKAPAESI